MNLKTTCHGSFRGRAQWTAIDDDTYDGHGSPVGYGSSAGAAVVDLLDQIEGTLEPEDARHYTIERVRSEWSAPQ